MTSVNQRLDKLAGLSGERDTSMDAFKRKLAGIRLTKRNEGIGRFQLGDQIHWRARAGLPEKRGVIIEVVKRGKYPSRDHKNLKLYGYYRETESYVVEADGRQFWPRVGNLKRGS